MGVRYQRNESRVEKERELHANEREKELNSDFRVRQWHWLGLVLEQILA